MGGNYTLPRASPKREMLAWGKWKADKEAKKTALIREQAPIVLIAILFPCPLAKWAPWYTP
jgi:hypothetical protein